MHHNKKLSFFIFFYLFSVTLLFAADEQNEQFIRPIRTRLSLLDTLTDINANDLLVLDVDDTLIANCNPYSVMMILNMNRHYIDNREHVDALMRIPEEVREFETRFLIWKVVESDLVDRLWNLKEENGVKIIALTSLDPGERFGDVDALEYRVRQLQECGFDFFSFTPEEEIHLGLFSRQGVYFSGRTAAEQVTDNGTAKAIILQRYCEVHPGINKVIFIDNYVNEVNQRLFDLRREGFSVHYTAMEGTPSTSLLTAEEFIDQRIRGRIE